MQTLDAEFIKHGAVILKVVAPTEIVLLVIAPPNDPRQAEPLLL